MPQMNPGKKGRADQQADQRRDQTPPLSLPLYSTSRKATI